MNVGIIGLGRMGQVVAQRLLEAGHKIIGFDTNNHAMQQAQQMGIQQASSVIDLATRVTIIWLMLPAGEIIDQLLAHIMHDLPAGTIIVDGGNSHFTDTVRRAQMLAKHHINFLDCGTSGGLQGRELGFSLMIGGNYESFKKIEPLFMALAMPQGYAFFGPSGAGHYIKMIHNGIEYALLEAYAEGFELLKEGRYPNLDLATIARVWNHGSIIRSYIVTLLQTTLSNDAELKQISGSIGENGTGQWTVEEAQKLGVAIPCIEKALHIRAWSRKTGGNYATKLIAMLRHQFGGHTITKKGDDQ